MRNKNWFKSKRQQHQALDAPITSLPRRIGRLLGLVIFGGTLALLAMSLGACAHNSPVCPEVVIPQKPALTQDLPSVSYSIAARESLSKWRAKLIDTPVTPKP